MIFLKLCLYAMIMSSCNNTTDTIIIGIANNAKAGAIVISNKDQKMYYVDKISSWEDSIIGKTVKVTGNLKVEVKKAPKPGEDIPQQIIGERMILIKPKWQLVE